MSAAFRRLALSALLCAGCAPLENSLVYHPAPSDAEPLPEAAPAKDLHLTTAAGDKIHARWCPRPGSDGAILFCPGNAGNLEMRAHAVHRLWKTQKQSVLIFDYPGYGQSTGRPGEQANYAAAGAAYDWLNDVQKIPPEKIILFGESLGGGVAAHLAGVRPHRALVLVRTFTSLPDVARARLPLLPYGSIMVNRYPSEETLRRAGGPVFIAQADADRLIPFAHGKRLEEAAGPDVSFHVLRGLGHNDPLPDDFYDALRGFLALHPR